MKSRHLLALAIASVVTAAAAAVTTPAGDDYAYAWPLRTDGSSAAWQVELTPDVYAAVTRADLGDVEVINADGEAVAVASHRPAATTIVDAPRPLALFALPANAATAVTGNETISLHVQRDGDGKLRSIDARVAAPNATVGGGTTGDPSIDAVRARVLLADASAVRLPLATLAIDWAAGADVTAQFAVEASDDLQHWRSVVTNASVLRLAQGDHVLERHDIDLGGVHAAYLRLRRLDDGPPLRGLRVAVTPSSRATLVQSTRTWIAATAADGEALAPSRAGTATPGAAYRYRLPAPLAIEALRVRLADDNTLATMTLLAHPTGPRADPASWTPRGGLVAFRLRQGETVLENDDVPVTIRDRVVDLRIETNTPLQHPPVVSVAYRPDRFVFLAQGRGPFRLVAGSTRRMRAAYPMDDALAPLRAQLGGDWQPPLATLGARQPLQGDRARVAPPPEAPRDGRTWLLWAVLIGAAAVIGGLALRLLRSPSPTE